MIRNARPEDRAAVEALLLDAGLPIAGVEEHFASFSVADEDGHIVAAAGLEIYAGEALLRSVVVHASAKGAGLGSAITRRVLDGAVTRGVRAIYLLTTTADAFFPRFGFTRIERSAFPPAFGASHELRGACPATAIAMRWLATSSTGDPTP